MNWVHFSLGKCLFKIGEFDAAIEALEDNLTYCEDRLSHFHAWYFKAICHHRAGRSEAARDALARAGEFEELFGSAEIPEETAFLEELDAMGDGGRG